MIHKSILLGLVVALASATTSLGASAQAQQQVAALKAAIQSNKAMLATYTWQQLESVAVNGTVKKQTQYLVVPTSSGLQKTVESATPQQGHAGLIKHHIEANYEEYGKQIAALAQSYAQPDPAKLQQLYVQGDVTVGSGGGPNSIAVHISNYVKQGDSVNIVFNKAKKSIVSLSVASYLNGPSDAVTINAQFSQLPDGTNYAQTLTVNGASKGLTVTQVNSNFQKR
jgi:hypothetical protein